jgi:hypothetical protein
MAEVVAMHSDKLSETASPACLCQILPVDVCALTDISPVTTYLLVYILWTAHKYVIIPSQTALTGKIKLFAESNFR